jgi:hypothetical protein
LQNQIVFIFLRERATLFSTIMADTTNNETNNTAANTSSTEKKEEDVHGWYVASTGFNVNEYLEKRIKGQLAYFNSKSSEQKNKYFNYQWTLIICSSLTPILVSVSESSIFQDGWPHNIIYAITLITSFIVSVLAAALKTFKYQENWTTTRAVCEMINREKFLYEAGVGEYASSKRRDATFVERIEGLLAREQNQWLNASTNAEKRDAKDEDKDGDGIPDKKQGKTEDEIINHLS